MVRLSIGLLVINLTLNTNVLTSILILHNNIF